MKRRLLQSHKLQRRLVLFYASKPEEKTNFLLNVKRRRKHHVIMLLVRQTRKALSLPSKYPNFRKVFSICNLGKTILRGWLFMCANLFLQCNIFRRLFFMLWLWVVKNCISKDRVQAMRSQVLSFSYLSIIVIVFSIQVMQLSFQLITKDVRWFRSQKSPHDSQSYHDYSARAAVPFSQRTLKISIIYFIFGKISDFLLKKNVPKISWLMEYRDNYFLTSGDKVRFFWEQDAWQS